MLSVHTKKKSRGDFKYLQFEERFPKAPFSWRISVERSPSRRIKFFGAFGRGIVTLFGNFMKS